MTQLVEQFQKLDAIALVSMLSNVAYIGYYLYNGVLVSKEAYEPIVPMDDFLYAYSRLSGRTLDGETNESKPKVDRRYSVGINALLEGSLSRMGVQCTLWLS